MKQRMLSSKTTLAFRPPYDWDGLLGFLDARRIEGVESIADRTYRRTVAIGEHHGWIAVSRISGKCALGLQFSRTLAPVRPALLERVRNLFDLRARPDLIAAQLMKHKALRESLRLNQGLRVPGAFDGFELAVRAILGQQVTVKAATTLSCRFAAQFGEKISTPFPELARLAPAPQTLATATVDSIARLGIISSRARSIIALAQECSSGRLQLEAGVDPQVTITQLCELPGIGPWTAHYIAMRALRWPDAFPKEDIALLNRLGGLTPKEAEALSQAWRPWRSYAVLHVWNQAPRKIL
jgi:AraC family transcriptional regulator of adaptative response / DNA-3-methyladenine glycosylase II